MIAVRSAAEVLRELDDYYLEVMHREEELQSKEEPSRIGILVGMRKVTPQEILKSPMEEAEAETQ